MERALHKYLDQIGIPRLEPVSFDELGPDYKKCTFRLVLFLLYLKN